MNGEIPSTPIELSDIQGEAVSLSSPEGEESGGEEGRKHGSKSPSPQPSPRPTGRGRRTPTGASSLNLMGAEAPSLPDDSESAHAREQGVDADWQVIALAAACFLGVVLSASIAGWCRMLWRRLTWRVECAWCGRHLSGPRLPARWQRTSHGMCPQCF